MKPLTAHRLARSYAIFIFAWLLFELAVQVFPAIGIPNWALRLLVLVSLVGCPVGVILLWIFSRRADAHRSAAAKASSFWAVLTLAIVSVIGGALVAMVLLVAAMVSPAPMLEFIVLFLPGTLAAFGLWYGRRWGWWLQLFSSLIHLLLFPVGTMIAGLGIAFLLWIRPAYFRLSPPPVPGAVLRAILLRILLLLCIGITLLVGLGFVLSGLEAWKASLRLSSALHGAREVTFVEFQRGFSSHEIVFQRVPAKPEDIARLKAATSPWSAFVPPWGVNCFTPHHRIEVTRADGTQTQLEICFLCHNFAFDEEDEISLPVAWERSLRGFFASVGMPTRTSEEYGEGRDILADLSAIQTELEEYKAANGVYPTTDQGLRALVLTPVSSPVPGHWMQLFREEPLDPWGTPYVYQCPGTKNPNKYDLFSAGPDHFPYTSDDDWGDDAQNDLRLIYENGEGVPTAAEFLQKAADQGNVFAQNNLGFLYYDGEGVPKDAGKAAELWQKAADLGYASAQNNLGLLYQFGEGVPEDLKKAAELYQKAVDQGNAFAQFNLGRLYDSGNGVHKDAGKAVELYQKAADQGDAVAQFRLGQLYQNGDGVPKDLGKAAELYKKAANQGYKPANEKIKALPFYRRLK